MMKGRLIFVGVLVLLLAASHVATDPPVAGGESSGEITLAGTVASKISYQGRLTDAGGNPLDGSYNLVFQLWDDATVGGQVGSDIVKNSVPVSNGLFTVDLDVPQDAFNGQSLWLQISVSGQMLSPRQELLPVPYALSLKPGAHVEGDSSDTIFSATNTGGGDALRGTTSNPSGHGVYGEATDTGNTRNYGGFFVAEGSQGRGVYGKAANAAGEVNYGGFFYASGVQGRGVFGQSTGSEGIGVKGWASDEGDVENYGGHFTAAGSRGIGVYAEGSNLGVQAESDNWAIYGNGYIGVGGFGLKPRDGDSYGGYFDALGSHAVGVQGVARSEGDAENYGGVFTAAGDSGRGVYGEAWGRNGVGVYAKYTGTGSGGYAVYAEATQRGTGVYGLSPGIAVVGQNSTSNTFGGLGWGNAGAYGTSGSNTGGYLGTSRAGVEGLDWDIHSGKYGVYAESDNGTGLYSVGGRGAYSAEFQGNVLIRGRDTGNPVMELGEGLDYAEGFDVSDRNELLPGTVLIIDPDNPSKLTTSRKAYDMKVAGIVAGAKGSGSAIRLGAGQYDYDVALAGRVYCNVDATEAAVEPGDLLTTSATPGYAMKATDYSRAQGAILGKAMERLEKGGKGQILVLVTLQ